MRQHKLTVLLVDDDDLDRERIHRLVSNDIQLQNADCGEQARECVSRHQPDCIIIDYHLPDTEGLELLQEFVRSGQTVILVTGQGDEEVAVDAMKLGAMDYLPKRGITTENLDRAIRHAVEKMALTKRVREQQEELKLFALVASHDLKAPLRTITHFTGFIQNEIAEMNQDALLGDCRRVVNAAVQMNQLVDDLLIYAKSGRSSIRFKPVDLNDVAQEVVSRSEAVIQERNGKVGVDHLPTVTGDRTGLSQLFQNLILNGIKYCRNDTTPEVRVSGKNENGTLHVRVEDNGIGISEKHHESVFNPFRRLHSKSEYEGTGLGLALCKRVAEQHGGRIWVESEKGKGSTFHFTLPLSVSEPEPVKEPTMPAATPEESRDAA